MKGGAFVTARAARNDETILEVPSLPLPPLLESHPTMLARGAIEIECAVGQKPGTALIPTGNHASSRLIVRDSAFAPPLTYYSKHPYSILFQLTLSRIKANHL